LWGWLLFLIVFLIVWLCLCTYSRDLSSLGQQLRGVSGIFPYTDIYIILLIKRVLFIIYSITWYFQGKYAFIHIENSNSLYLISYIVLGADTQPPVTHSAIQNSMFHNRALQNGTLQSGTELQNDVCFKTVHNKTIQLQNGTLLKKNGMFHVAEPNLTLDMVSHNQQISTNP
jgi:hypothetical protein